MIESISDLDINNNRHQSSLNTIPEIDSPNNDNRNDDTDNNNEIVEEFIPSNNNQISELTEILISNNDRNKHILPSNDYNINPNKILFIFTIMIILGNIFNYTISMIKETIIDGKNVTPPIFVCENCNDFISYAIMGLGYILISCFYGIIINVPTFFGIYNLKFLINNILKYMITEKNFNEKYYYSYLILLLIIFKIILLINGYLLLQIIIYLINKKDLISTKLATTGDQISYTILIIYLSYTIIYFLLGLPNIISLAIKHINKNRTYSHIYYNQQRNSN